MTLPAIHGEARIVGAPELRYTPSGQPVLNVRLVSNRRKYNDQTQQWEDTGVCWLRGALWGKPGENAAAYLAEKDLVLFEGELETREWEKDGEKRTATEVKITRIAKVPPRQDGPQGGGNGGYGGGQRGGGYGGQQQGGGFGGGQTQGGWGSQEDEPPF